MSNSGFELSSCYHCEFGFKAEGPMLNLSIGEEERGKLLHKNCEWASSIKFPLDTMLEPFIITNSGKLNFCSAFQRAVK